MKTADRPILLEQTFQTSTSELWEAITNADQMREWFFDNIEDFRPEVGFETQFVVHVDAKTFTHCWEVTEAIANERITYRWRYLEYPGDAIVSFELFEEQDFVLLRLKLDVVANFPDEIPEFTRESCLQGWQYFIGKNLVNYMDTK